MKNADLRRIIQAKELQSLDDGSGDVVYAIFLEPHEPPKGSDPSFADRMVSFVVQNMQPSPVMVHVELVVPRPPGSSGPVSFATYIGERSAWRGVRPADSNCRFGQHAPFSRVRVCCTSASFREQDRKDNEAYYLVENANKWRALPVFGPSAARLVRESCNKSVGAEYSMLRYATASKVLRGLSSLVADKPKSPAHCATLTARVIRRALGDKLEHPSAWYGPATLYAALRDELKESRVAPESTHATNDTATAVHSVLRWSSQELDGLSDEDWLTAIRALTLKTAAAETHGDQAMQKLTQKQLATALLRWSVIRHSQNGSNSLGTA